MVWRCCQVSCLGPSVQWPSGASYQLYNYTWPPLLLIMETLCKKISILQAASIELETLMGIHNIWRYIYLFGTRWSIHPRNVLDMIIPIHLSLHLILWPTRHTSLRSGFCQLFNTCETVTNCTNCYTENIDFRTCGTNVIGGLGDNGQHGTSQARIVRTMTYGGGSGSDGRDGKDGFYESRGRGSGADISLYTNNSSFWAAGRY